MPTSAVPGRSGSSLTERYVYAVTRRLPEDQRTEVGEELRGTIADRIDALAADRPDADRTANERLALDELGDPDRLAAGYTGHRLHLIGPELYPAWKRLLQLVLAVAVPSVALVVAVIDAFSGEPFGEVLGGVGRGTAAQRRTRRSGQLGYTSLWTYERVLFPDSPAEDQVTGTGSVATAPQVAQPGTSVVMVTTLARDRRDAALDHRQGGPRARGTAPAASPVRLDGEGPGEPEPVGRGGQAADGPAGARGHVHDRSSARSRPRYRTSTVVQQIRCLA